MQSEPTATRQTIRFAHLSDPHLSSLVGVSWRDLVNKRLLGYLSWLKKRRAEHRPEILDALKRDLEKVSPEHIVVTGDLTHIGLQDEFRQARHWLESLGTPDRVTVIPGNHDSYVRSPWAQSYLHWESYMASDVVKTGRETSDTDSLFPSLRIRGPVAFIGLSSARPSAPLLAVGSVGAKQLDRFRQLLQQTGSEGFFRVVLIHHNPVPGEEKWRKRLTDAADVSHVIEQCGAELVLHGHGHRAVESSIEVQGGRVPVLGIPSASAAGLKPGRTAQYYLYEIIPATDGWKLNIAVHGFRADKAQFVSQQQRSIEIHQPT